MRKIQPLNLNVASSYHVLEDFVNIDNSLWQRLLPFYPVLKYVLKPDHRKALESYSAAKQKATLVRYDCRKRLNYNDNSVDHILCSHFLEHVYHSEANKIVGGFYRILKPGGTIHIIVPDITQLAQNYLDNYGEVTASAQFLTETLLTHPNPPSFTFRFLEFIGGFGLQHRWMYDKPGIIYLLESLKFVILDNNETASKHFREGDDSIHVVGQKPL